MQLPKSFEAEVEVLSFIFTYEDKADEIIEVLSDEDFFNKANSRIFKEFKNGNKNPELIITNLFNDFLEIESYIEQIITSKKRVSKISHCVDILKEMKRYRDMIDFGQKLIDDGYNREIVTDEELIAFQNTINSVDAKCELESIYECSMEYLRNYNNKPEFLKSRLRSLDDVFKFERSDLIVVGARPSMGKTAFQLQLGIGYAMNNHKVIAFSLEMKNSQLTQRILSNVCKIQMGKIKGKILNDPEKEILENKIKNQLKHLPLKITDSIYSPKNIISVIKKEKEKNGLDIVLVDYLQLIQTLGKNRTQEIGDITRTFKLLAKSLNIGIIFLAQLSRSLEQRVDKRPILSDLRDSGEIEQDVDSAIFLYRDEYYNEDSEDKNIMEAIIRKQRNGSLGNVPLYFNGATQEIRDF